MKAMVRVLALAMTVLLLPACLIPNSKDRYDRTPNGWHVHWLEQGTITTGLHSKLQVLVQFDVAMERSFPECAAKVGLPEDYVRRTIRDRDALYTLHDDSIFQVAPGSADNPTGTWASGLEVGRTHSEVAYYLWISVAPAAVPVDAPGWTLHQNPNRPAETIYGKEVDGGWYPALGYELHWQFTEIP